MKRVHAAIALEWSPTGVSLYDGAKAQTSDYADITEISGQSGRPAIIGVSRRSLFLRTTRVPAADRSTVRQILEMKASELFPVALGEVAIDFLPLNDFNAEGQLAVVVAIPAGELKRIRKEAQQVGIKVDRIVPLSLGSALVLRKMGRSDGAVVSQDAGGLGIDIIDNGNLVHSRTIATGLSFEGEVCRTFKVAGLPCGDIVTVGNLGGNTSLISSSTPMQALLEDWPADWELNLQLAEDVIAHQKLEARNRLQTALLLGVAAFGLVAYAASDFVDQNEKVSVVTRKAQGKQRKLKAIQKEAETSANLAIGYERVVKRAFRPAQRLGDVVTLVANRVPKGVWLTGVSVERGKAVLIRGSAKTSEAVTAYTESLAKEDRLRDVQLVFANNAVVSEIPIVQFSISAFPVGNVPLFDPTKRSKAVKK